MKTYAPRTTVRFEVIFTRVSDSIPVDPTDVLFHVQYASAPVVTRRYSLDEVVRSDVGVYYVDFTPDLEGQWRYAWQGTGTIQSSTLDVIFRVMQSDLID